jgi:hypothetical protein
MLKQKEDVQAETGSDPSAANVAVIAAGMFAALGSAAAGVGERTTAASASANAKPDSKWKSAAQREALR